jgi:hypothetical protein
MKVLADIFPAHLAVIAAGALEDVYDLKSNPPTAAAFYKATTRIVVTDEAVFVAQDSPNGAQIIFQEKYELFLRAADPKSDYRIITKSGKMLAFQKDTNCGCGSRLRGWNAYKTISSIKDSI